jgi:hypothetical protein
VPEPDASTELNWQEVISSDPIKMIITIKICGQIEFFFISLTIAFLFMIGHDSIAVKAGGSFPYFAQNSSINQTNKE